MQQSPIIATELGDKLNRGETNFAEMSAWGENARQLRNVADLLADMAADCIVERRKGQSQENHAYCRIRASGHYELSHELMSMATRLKELQEKAWQECKEAEQEHEFDRVRLGCTREW